MRSRWSSAASPPRRRDMPAPSIRSPPASCRLRSARRPRPCPSSWTGVNPTCSPSPGARRPPRTTPRARSSSAPTSCRTRPRSRPIFPAQVQQVPPRFSAIKIAGERAYDLARDGEVVELQPRTVEIDRLSLIHHEGNRSVIEADCGKGTYVRAIARDLGRALGCLGHIAALRRTRVGPFTEHDAVTVDDIATDPAALRPVETALSDLPSIAVSRDMAGPLMRGQSVILRGREAPVSGKVYATCGGVLVAVGDVERGELVPHRVFNLGV